MPPPGYQFVDIRGIPPVDGSPGIRKEFTAFATDKPKESIQVSLFIRALIRWYKRPYTDRFSYFQIAGIHGWPYGVSWDYSKGPQHDYGDDHFIYCNHNLLTFPTWHRPYMALFEQTLWQIMNEVIENELKFNSDAEKQTWIKEKDSFRLPYWDWARPSYEGEIPELFKDAEIKVREPLNADGTLPTPLPVDNPLYRYQLYKDGKLTRMGDLPSPYTVEDSDDHPWSKCSGTSRYGVHHPEPTEQESEGKSDAEQIAKAINAHKYYGSADPDHHIEKLAVSDLVYRLLLGDKNPTWAEFSSTVMHNPKTDPHWKEWISLEYIHNNLHNFVGGDTYKSGIGHMMDVPVAAFDPIFFMHHCNIDHYFAMWQTLYDNVWFTDKDTPSPLDDLPPFRHKFDGERGVDYFNSDDIRDWTTLGYQYDVLQRRTGEDDAAYKQRIRSHITDSYPHTGDVILKDRHGVFSSHGEVGGSVLFADQGVDDYVINVIYDRYGHNRGSPYTIHFFLGDAPQQETIRSLGTAQAAPSILGAGHVATTVSELPRHVGSVYTFSSSMVPGTRNTAGSEAVSVCPNCAQQHNDGVLSRASVSLTIPLYHDAANNNITEIDSPFDGDAVRGYLADRLSWIAVNTQGTIIRWSGLGNTRVFVLKGKGKHHPLYSMVSGESSMDDQGGVISKYSHYEALSEVTRGKEVGATPDEYDRLMPGSA
ncbi:Di-copper centre-containing protein [Rhypophila decipiens]